ncbi:unnamed protein product [Ectocarpus sp. 12 AP-2014]
MDKTLIEVQKTSRFYVYGAVGSSSAVRWPAFEKSTTAASTSAGSPAKGSKKGAVQHKKAWTQTTDMTSKDTDRALDVPEDMDADGLAAAVTKQGSLVRQMKKDGASAEAIQAEVGKLQGLKASLAKATAAVEATSTFDGKAMDDLVIRRMFVVPSFEIHGGVSGLYDLGPPGCGLKGNIVSLWKQHFILAEGMLEMECTNLTPENVLQTSGHVDRFTDLMVKDTETGESLRADKLLEDIIDKLLAENPAMPTAEREEHLRVQRMADAYSAEELGEVLDKYGAKSPQKNDLTKPFPFNLMFKTTIGPEGTQVGFFRPETAQGLFVNFRRLLDYNAQRMPFAAAQVGLGFRNEISPRAGLLRVREFCMAEIEHFVDPKDKKHPKFATIAGKELVLFGQDAQLGTGKTSKMTIGQAVKDGLVDNETLGYFMTRTQLFLEMIGMDPKRMRFRQHLSTEMAHYAADCWDMEIQVSDGWTECVGHADRSCYDLEMHSKKTGVAMLASCKLPEPKVVTEYKLQIDRKALGKTFKAEQKKVIAALEALSEKEEDLLAFQAKLEEEGKASLGEGAGFEITKGMCSWTKGSKKISEIKFTPSVIEPSFGIGRILHSLLEHSFYVREAEEGADDKDMKRGVMAFRPLVAPIKCAVFPLSSQAAFFPLCGRVMDALGKMHLSAKMDASGAALGRRYARMDELGAPFGVTVDFQTVEDETVTLRERDSMTQIRMPMADVAPLMARLVTEEAAWKECTSKYPVVREEAGDSTSAAAAAASVKTAAGGSALTTESTPCGMFSRPTTPIQVKP